MTNQTTTGLPADDAGYRLAVLLVLSSSTMNSFGGLIVRSVESASDWQIVFYRSLGLASGIFFVCLLRHGRDLGRQFLAVGPWGLLGSLFLAAAATGYVHAITRTTVANALFILSSLPLLTAVLSYLFLGERVRRGTWIAMAVALVGIVIMVAGGLATGAVAGNVIALATALAFASFVVILRRGRNGNMLPVAVIGAGLAATGAAIFSGAELAASRHDMLLCFAWGALLHTLVHVLFIQGSKQVQGAEITLLILVEFALGPVWVWVFMNETAAPTTLLGGLVVMAAVAGRAVGGMRPRRPPTKL